MDLAAILEALARPQAYPHAVDRVEVRHTHISAVFLAGPYAYKIKKPLDLGFLDFTTLEKRRHFCLEEVRLNRRLAPGVYLGVVPIALGRGRVQVEGEGEVLEWAVWMARLPEDATLARRLARGELDKGIFGALARRVAEFHACAEAGEAVSRYGRWEVVARNARENLEQAAPHAGTTVSPTVLQRLRDRTEASLEHLKPVIESRARRGVPRDTHGDLHLDHIYTLSDRPEPGDLLIVDCIEFNERFRFADPVADMAFLAMDLKFQGRRDLAQTFADGYFEASGDEEGRLLLPFYTAYRAAVRGKVEGFEVFETEVPGPERLAARDRARAHWLVAVGELEEPVRKPCLVLVGGLPGTGKSSIARGLSREAGFVHVSSDVIRKELAGLPTAASAAGPFGEGIYTPEWTDRTYAECLRRAEEFLFQGERVIVDANFRAEARRKPFLDAALRWGVPGLFLLRTADPREVLRRLERRKGDASDADWAVYLRAAAAWEEPAPETRKALRAIPMAETKKDALDKALAVLAAEGLWAD